MDEEYGASYINIEDDEDELETVYNYYMENLFAGDDEEDISEP